MDDNPLQDRLAVFNDYTYPELAVAMQEAKEAYDAAKARANRLYDEFQFIARQVIPTRMERDQIKNITVNMPDGVPRKLLVIPQVSVKTPPENKEALWAWLKEHDADDIISETVNASTLASYVRRQMEDGEEYPDEICDVNIYDVASLRKA